MKIPKTDSELDQFAVELCMKCTASRDERRSTYTGLKHYYLFGAQEGDIAPYGKIAPHLDLLTAYLYSQGTVEFDVGVQNVAPEIYEQAELVSHRTNLYFHDHGIADRYSEALTWSLVYNSSFMKFVWDASCGVLRPYFIQPHDIGVLREDVPDLSDQEAFVHCYPISMDELKRRIQHLPNKEDILRRVTAQPLQSDDAFPEAVNRLIVAGTVNMQTTTTQGMVNVPDLLGQLTYRPRTVEDLVDMFELWVWDDEAEDYRTITVASPGVMIYSGKQVGNKFGIKGDHPFIHLCPNRLYDYFFGWSEIVPLIKLQDWATERLRQIRTILTKQAEPSKVFSGFGGITDERMAAFDMPGGWLAEQMPGAKVEAIAPEVPPDIFQELMMIQHMYNDVSGLSDILQGKGESGVRSKAHADVLSKLGSARIKKRAQSVEKSLEEIGALIVSVMRAKDPHKFRMKSGQPFIASQFTSEFEVHVDAHSASPVFVDDHVQLAFALKKFGSIDDESLLELTRPPKLETLKQRVKQMRAERAKAMQEAIAAGAVPGKRGLKAV